MEKLRALWRLPARSAACQFFVKCYRSGAHDLKDTERHEAVADHQSGCYYADHTHEFDQDIETRTTGVLERISDRISDHSSLVCFGSFTSVRTSFDILLRIIPGPCMTFFPLVGNFFK